MKVYLVGGYLRDKLRGADLEGLDKDYVVVGSTPDEMLKKGFKSVGSSFPVYLHPDTKEEYALARKEIKTSEGYHGFKFEFTPDITLEEDLYRRDFTINAMAQSLNSGDIIDPYGGREDLDSNILRHVSEHFSEDPLRLIRAARFHAILGFEIASSTRKLLEQIVASQELQTISKERIVKEIEKTANRGDLNLFTKVLIDLEAWGVLFQKSPPRYSVPETQNDFHKLVFFFHALDRSLLEQFPISNSLKKLVKALDSFEKLSEEKQWIELLDQFDAWRPGADYFTQCLDCICELHGQKWQFLSELRLYIRENLDKSGLDQYQGADYGKELRSRREQLCHTYIQANPLK